MKKTWMLAALAISILAGCSKDASVAEEPGGGNEPTIDPNAPQEIVLGAGQAVTAAVQRQSRGIGSVGNLEGTDDATTTNDWNGETLYIYGISCSLTDTDGSTKTAAIDGEAATAPANGTAADAAKTTLTWATAGRAFYYNGTDLYDFYGCHLDDAATAPTVTDAKAALTVNVNIDGTQDLMVGMPDKEADINGNADVTSTTNLYSAWSSRRKVTPNLVFTHVLSRLVFKAKCGNSTAYADGKEVKITGVTVTDVITGGTLTIIPASDGTQGFTAGTTTGDFVLMQSPADPATDKNLVAFTGYSVTGNKTADFTAFGAPMMLVPAATYDIVVSTEQDANGDNTIAENEKGTIEQTLTITDGFVAGSSYNVNITVYGLEEIKIDATLTAWKDGGDIPVDPDSQQDGTNTNPPSGGNDASQDDGEQGSGTQTGGDATGGEGQGGETPNPQP